MFDPIVRLKNSATNRLRERLPVAVGIIDRICRPPDCDELAAELETAVGILFTGDRSKLDDLVTGAPSREEALRLCTVLTERLITSVSMVAHETGEDLFTVWARQCHFAADESLQDDWYV